MRALFSVDHLPAWCNRHGVEVNGLKVAGVEGRGNAWIAHEDLKSEWKDVAPAKTLLVIPKDIIISVDLVMQYAAENAQFKQLIDAVEFQVSVTLATGAPHVRCLYLSKLTMVT